MPKRFTDSEKWKDAWFMDLPSKYKLFWIYILDECNHAGIWKVNFKVASFYIGEHLEYSEVKRILNDRITLLDDEYWYIDKFIKYQYKCDIQGLNPKNKAHLSVIKILKEHEYFKEKIKPLASPLKGVKDKDKDKDILVNKEKNEKKVLVNLFTEKDFINIWNEQRTKFLKVPSHLNRLDFEEKQFFKDCIDEGITNDQFKHAAEALFRQSHVPNASMHKRPKNLLKSIYTYLQAYEEKDKSLYNNN